MSPSVLANTQSGAGSDGFKLFVNGWQSSNQTLHFETGTGGSDGLSATSANGVFAWDAWNQVVATVDTGQNTAKIYYNGELVATDSIIDGFPLSGTTYIGQFADSSYELDGQLDDLCIYDSVLTSDEISATYLAAVPEPFSVVLLGFGIGLLGLLRRYGRIC